MHKTAQIQKNTRGFQRKITVDIDSHFSHGKVLNG